MRAIAFYKFLQFVYREVQLMDGLRHRMLAAENTAGPDGWTPRGLCHDCQRTKAEGHAASCHGPVEESHEAALATVAIETPDGVERVPAADVDVSQVSSYSEVRFDLYRMADGVWIIKDNNFNIVLKGTSDEQAVLLLWRLHKQSLARAAEVGPARVSG